MIRIVCKVSCKVKIGQRHCLAVTILATVKLSEQVYNAIGDKVK